MAYNRRKKGEITFQLFSFLDVLLCTLGGLIIILTIVVHKARAHVHEIQEAQTIETAEQVAALQTREEEELWRRDVLEQAREEKSRELANQRLELGHLEEHINRIKERWRDLVREAEKLKQLQDNPGASQDSSATLAALQREIELARQELEGAKAKGADRPRAFTIVPYAGPYGTRRRPIYVECSQDSITLQPEGIQLRPEDFEGPMTAGNPLDAALRSAREYLARNGDTKVNGEPYPLLIVRPDGAVAYAAARSAMKSWEDEFGYELVSADMELAYPAADPGLVEQLNRAVADARERQQTLMAAMPSQYRSRPAAGGPIGGFVIEEGGGTLDDSWGSGHGVGGRRGSDSEPGIAAGATRSGRGVMAGTSTSGQDTSNSSPLASRNGQQKNQRGSIDDPNSGNSSGKSSSDGSAGNQRTAGGSSAAEGEGSPAAFSSFKGGTGQRATSPAMARGTSKKSFDKQGLTGITRPIEAVCYPDRLVLLPERGNRAKSVEVPLNGDPYVAFDLCLEAIEQRVDSWGLAIANGYWKPVLSVQVASGAQRQFSDLQQSLEGTGIVIKAKGAPSKSSR